ERVSRSLERSRRVPGYQFAVLAVELERFKLIENAYGPRFAQDVVVGLAARLKKCLRPGDIVASLSPDRFAVLADHIRPASAVRRAKLRGGGTFEIFDPDMQAESLARVVIESELHHAVERGELVLQYQPVVRLDGGRIDGFEALLRWRHPARGLLRPAEFLAAADTTGLMAPITRWVIG